MYHTMKFRPRYVGPILNGDKTATIRYGWDHLSPGDTIAMINAETGEQFAVADIDVLSHSSITNAPEAVRLAGGEHRADRPIPLLNRLNEYYEEDLTLETEVTGVMFTVREDLRGPDTGRRRGRPR